MDNSNEVVETVEAKIVMGSLVTISFISFIIMLYIYISGDSLPSIVTRSFINLKSSVNRSRPGQYRDALSSTSPNPSIKKNQGESCTANIDCDGWTSGLPGSLACCNGKCSPYQKNWLGVGVCPHECKDAPPPLGGACDRGFSWPRKEGEPCDTNIGCDTGLCSSGKCATACPDGTITLLSKCMYRRTSKPPTITPCPPGTRDDGINCWVDTYGRGSGYTIWESARCASEHSQGCEQHGLMFYPKCADGYHSVGCCLCEPNGGPGIKKTLLEREGCDEDHELYNNMCYPKPLPNFNCVGNTCTMDR